MLPTGNQMCKVITYWCDDMDGLSRELKGSIPLPCGCNSGELGTEASERRLCVSGSTSDIEPCLFFLRENALVNDDRSWNETRDKLVLESTPGVAELTHGTWLILHAAHAAASQMSAFSYHSDRMYTHYFFLHKTCFRNPFNAEWLKINFLFW